MHGWGVGSGFRAYCFRFRELFFGLRVQGSVLFGLNIVLGIGFRCCYICVGLWMWFMPPS